MRIGLSGREGGTAEAVWVGMVDDGAVWKAWVRCIGSLTEGVRQYLGRSGMTWSMQSRLSMRNVWNCVQLGPRGARMEGNLFIQSIKI